VPTSRLEIPEKCVYVCLTFCTHVSKPLWHQAAKAACIQATKAIQIKLVLHLFTGKLWLEGGSFSFPSQKPCVPTCYRLPSLAFRVNFSGIL